jgi:hypothetical protein
MNSKIFFRIIFGAGTGSATYCTLRTFGFVDIGQKKIKKEKKKNATQREKKKFQVFIKDESGR